MSSVGMKIKNHGNGFLRVYLSEDSLLHFYSDDMPRQAVDTSIHDHRWDFISTILFGSLTQYLYVVVPGMEYRLHHSDDNDHLQDANFVVGLEMIGWQEFHEGDTYRLNVGHIHRVVTRGVCVTSVARQVHTDWVPRIFVPTGSSPDNGFDNSIR